jgi:hypothetical protein
MARIIIYIIPTHQYFRDSPGASGNVPQKLRLCGEKRKETLSSEEVNEQDYK